MYRWFQGLLKAMFEMNFDCDDNEKLFGRTVTIMFAQMPF